MLILFKETKRNETKIRKEKNCLEKTRCFFQAAPSFGYFLLSFFIFSGAIITIINNYPIILEKIWGISDGQKTIIVLGSFLFSIVGGLSFGYLADKWGIKKILWVVLWSWIILLPILSFMPSFYFYVICSLLISLLIGACLSLPRALASYIIPRENRQLGFTFFNIAERSAFVIGPMVWGIVVLYFQNTQDFGYRFAFLAIATLIAFSLLFFRRIKIRIPVQD